MKKHYFTKTKALLQLLMLVPFFTFAQMDLLQTTNNVVTSAIPSCQFSPNVTFPNDFARLYNLTALGYSSFQVTKVSFAVHGFNLGTASNFPVSVKVYASTGGTVAANLTLISETTANITSAMAGTVVEVPLASPATVSSTEMFVVVSAPAGQTTSTGFYPGANSNGQTASGYVKATDCGATDFIDISTIAGPNVHLVLFPTGNPTLIPEGCLTVASTVPQWPTSTFTPQCTGNIESLTPSNDAETGEYSKVALTAGVAYTFSSSVTTDYVTISNEDGTVIYAHGTESVTWTGNSNEVVRFYIHLDGECNSSNAFRSRRVQCSNLNITDNTITTLSFYPNPVKDFLNLRLNKNIDNVIVVNLLGQTVLTQRINTQNTQIDMTVLPAGNYFVKITSEGTEKIINVIKQ